MDDLYKGNWKDILKGFKDYSWRVLIKPFGRHFHNFPAKSKSELDGRVVGAVCAYVTDALVAIVAFATVASCFLDNGLESKSNPVRTNTVTSQSIDQSNYYSSSSLISKTL